MPPEYKSSDQEETTETGTDGDLKIEDLQLGVWSLRIANSHSTVFEAPKKLWKEIQDIAPFVLRLITDVYTVAPYHLIVYLFCKFVHGLEDLFLLAFSDYLLRTVEVGLISGTPNVYEISVAILLRLACAFLFALLKWYGNKMHTILYSKVTGHLQLLLMSANLHQDLATSQEAASKSGSSAEEAWDAFDNLIRLIINVLQSGSQMAFIGHVARSTGGPWFVLLSLSHPLLSTYVTPALWSKVCFGYSSNPTHQRIKALEKLADGTLRQDIISGGLAEWIVSEYQRARRELGDLSTMHPFYQYMYRTPLINNMILEVTEFAPMIFCALNAALHPANFSISSVALLQQSSTHLRFSLSMTLSQAQFVNRNLSSLRNVYRSEDLPVTAMDKGVISYPQTHTDEKPPKGMSFDLSSVSFSYPGAQKTSPSLNAISLKIQAGQLVVIVGANGSGKSTLIRILSRLYDPSSGTVHIDGRPSPEYIVSDLHEATALLSQDSQLYPLSLRENIGLGYHAKVRDENLVEQAAEQGGATEFISKLKDGMDTVLEPMIQPFEMNLYNKKSHALYKEMEALRKKIDISGGERQKVVAARSFMRFRSGKIKFVAVDEPSSALDAEAELKLFENLIKVRDGKTLVFVTHRFGHLTKCADQIICMKDGAICESGSHDELMIKQGEYAKLYEIQASAFAQ